MVLGVMGCGDTIDAAVQTDEKIQGAWTLGDYTLYISSGMMSVKYYKDVVTPYRTEFAYTGAAATNRTAAEAAGSITGTFTFFDYKTNDEIASCEVTWTAAVDAAPAVEADPDAVPPVVAKDAVEAALATIELKTFTYEVEEYYYLNAFPKVGKYTALLAGDAVEKPLDATTLKYTVSSTWAAAFKYAAVPSVSESDITYDAGKGVVLALSDFALVDADGEPVTVTSPVSGTYFITFKVADDMTENIKGGTPKVPVTMLKADARTTGLEVQVKSTSASKLVISTPGALLTADDLEFVTAPAGGGTITNVRVFTDALHTSRATAIPATTGSLFMLYDVTGATNYADSVDQEYEAAYTT
jgi:hypothetical protein